MRLTPQSVAAATVALVFHAGLVIYLWRVLIAPQLAPSASIRWIELEPARQQREPIATKLTRSAQSLEAQRWSMPQVRPPVPPEVQAERITNTESTASAAALLQGVRVAEDLLEAEAYAKTRDAERLFGPPPKPRAPGVPTPAIDRFFRDPSRRRTELVGDTGDGVQRMIYTDEFGHQFVCSQRLGSPLDPAGMGTRRTCSLQGDGANNTEEWFKKRGID